MIEKLGYFSGGKRIFDHELTPDRRHLVLTEACDAFFSAKLTKAEVIELGQDFLRLAEQMSDGNKP